MKKKKENKQEAKEIEIKDSDNNLEIEEAEEEKKEESEVEEKSVSELEDKIKSLQDTVLRKAAEFENYKRRTENDHLNLFKYAAESFILKIIPVYDDLKRTIDHIDKSNVDSLTEGLNLVYDKFTKTLDEQGIKKLDVKGKEFDVDYHEALMQQPSDKVPPNTVLNEVESGYSYKDKIIKHAKVIVSSEIEDVAEESNENNNEIVE